MNYRKPIYGGIYGENLIGVSTTTGNPLGTFAILANGSLPTAGIISQMTAVTGAATNSITATYAGNYRITFSITFTPTESDILWEWAIFKSGAELPNIEAEVLAKEGGKEYAVCASGLALLAAGDVITIRVASSTASKVVTVHNSNLNIERIG
jgi:hypothetical protein